MNEAATDGRRYAMTGFPGWLAEAFIDDLSRRTDERIAELLLLVQPSQVDRARDVLTHSALTTDVVPYDLTGPPSIEACLRGVDVLVHMAGVIHVRKTSDWYRVNTDGTVRLARQAKRAGVRRFVYISSIAAAGKSREDRDLVESDEPKPEHHYGVSKLRAERELLAMHEPGSFDVVILRPSMFYGPPVPARHIAIYARVRDGLMPLVGGGAYKRSLVYISNLVQAVRLACAVPQAAGRTYFIVDRVPYTTKSVVEAMGAALGVEPRYLRLPAFVGTVAFNADRLLAALGAYVAPIHLVGESDWHQGASCEKAVRELGYEPSVALDGGMRLAIDWCRTRGFL